MFIHDHSRHERIGLSEAVFCEGKSLITIQTIYDELLLNACQPILFTRLTETTYEKLKNKTASFDYDPLSQTAFMHGVHPGQKGKVAVVSAGSSDLTVCREASRTLQYLGIKSDLYEDIGVAGLWRLEENLPQIIKHDLIIVVAGMDAAIVSVLGGLVGMPIIAVPLQV